MQSAPCDAPKLCHCAEASMGERRAVFVSVCLAAVLRGLLTLYGMWQDATMRLKYTDVDYYVFSDAAKLVSEVTIR